MKDITKSIVFPDNHLANVLTNETKRHRKIHNSTQLNKTIQPKHDMHKLTLIWWYSYDPRSGNEAASFGEKLVKENHCAMKWHTVRTGLFWRVLWISLFNQSVFSISILTCNTVKVHWSSRIKLRIHIQVVIQFSLRQLQQQILHAYCRTFVDFIHWISFCNKCAFH